MSVFLSSMCHPSELLNLKEGVVGTAEFVIKLERSVGRLGTGPGNCCPK